jgi:hypothetical protein
VLCLLNDYIFLECNYIHHHYESLAFGQFYQHFWHQSRAAFAQINFDVFDGNSAFEKMSQNMVLGAKAVTPNIQ